MYPSQAKRLEAIRSATAEKLASGRKDLDGLETEALVEILVKEALAEFYDDTIAANYDWDAVERVARRAVKEARGLGR